MILAWLILILSTAMFFFYFQGTCQKILRRQFGQDYFRSVVNAHRLEFLAVQTSLEEDTRPIDYARVRRTLQCDFLALTHLLSSVANEKLRYSKAEGLLILYFRWHLLSLAVRCLLKVGEKKATLRLTSVLQYFANVFGQRVNTVDFGNLTAANSLSSNL
jgi:hypothetical protein